MATMYTIGTNVWYQGEMHLHRGRAWSLNNHKQLPTVKGQVAEVEFYSRDWDTNKLHTKTFKVRNVM